MLQLRVFGDTAMLDDLGAWLEGSGHGRHAVLSPARRDGHSGLLTADNASPGLAGLITIGVGTVGVALAAGVAAMLAQETRARSAVGVAISVTTIPAAAYFGVAVVVGQLGDAGGALAVLGVNVAKLLVGGTSTLALQRWLYRRSGTTVAPKRGSA